MAWTIQDAGDLQGRLFLVTGSNAGIGYATSRLLAGRRATVIMACRNLHKARQAVTAIRNAQPDADLHPMELDLADLASVHRFSDAYAARFPRLDVLINNAGVMMPPFGRTADGFEIQFGTNVLGHFALTGRLMPMLENSPAARIVSLGSVAHWIAGLDFNNLNAERGYSAFRAYAQSKLANLIFAYELERRLRRAGMRAISLAAHPGGTNSELSRHQFLLRLVTPLAQSADSGALPAIRAAVDPQAHGGDHYGPSRMARLSGPPSRQRSSRLSHDPAIAERLWQVCEQLTGVRYPRGP